MHERAPLGEAPLLGRLSEQLQHELVETAEPVRLRAQEWLFREGDPGDRLYLVLSGRVRVLGDRDGRPVVLRTLGPGAVIGELAVLTGSQRSASIRALRDTELLEIDGERFQQLLEQSPELGAGLSRALAHQLQSGGRLEATEAPVAVVTVAGRPGALTDRLWDSVRHSFEELGETTTVASAETDWADPWAWGRDLAEHERMHDYVLLRAMLDDTSWSRFCLRQADRVLVLAENETPSDHAVPAGCDIVFVGTPSVERVAAWVGGTEARAHHVVGVEADLAAAGRRIARRVTGRSLGMVLSGGGARAFAHIGVLDVFARAGLVVDRFGGCSMGALIGAMAASGWAPETMIEVSNREMARRAPFNDYTIPRHALIRARRAGSMLRRLFGTTALEQLERPLFTISADLLSSSMIVHRTGELWETVGASMAIPGLAPPVPRHAQLLVDGGVLNNLPVDVMADSEAGPIVAVDVMRRLERSLEPSRRIDLPTILETLSRATVLGSARRAQSNRELADVLVTPDVQDIALRGFRHLMRAVDGGRRAAEEALERGAKDTLERARRRGARLDAPTATLS